MIMQQNTTLFNDMPAACIDELISELPRFSLEELDEMNRRCLKYRDLVRGGGTPTTKQDNAFLAFQLVCYAEGVNYGS